MMRAPIEEPRTNRARGPRGLALLVAVAIAIAIVACAKDDRGASCRTDEAGCSCSIGTPTSNACGPSNVQGALCCASSDWPHGGSCSCAAVTCTDDGTRCRCARGLGGPLAACSGALCCQMTSGDCYCRRLLGGVTPTCDPGDTPSAFCGPSAGARCGDGILKVDTCL